MKFNINSTHALALSSLPNDWEILLAKKIVIENKHEGYDLALDTFERSLPSDMNGDSWYFTFLIHYYSKEYDRDISQYVSILEKAREKGSVLAISTMYIIYSRPHLVSVIDMDKASRLKREYQKLVSDGVISNEYSFEMVVNTSMKLLGLY
ncbi:hypothetical protein [Vibrio sp. M260112]|uniref:hypothetical protein n=1 Tax=Vibrio sp. M260112 TaxID=3020895 RepID=UPI002F4144D6